MIPVMVEPVFPARAVHPQPGIQIHRRIACQREDHAVMRAAQEDLPVVAVQRQSIMGKIPQSEIACPPAEHAVLAQNADSELIHIRLVLVPLPRLFPEQVSERHFRVQDTDLPVPVTRP